MKHVYRMIISVLCCFFFSACGKENRTPVSGDWIVTADFGSVVFTVNPEGTIITKAVFHLQDFRCGPGSVSGSVSVDYLNGIVINKNHFSIKFDDNVQIGVPDPFNPAPPTSNIRRLLLDGEFKSDGINAFGTWESSFNGMGCQQGTWTGNPIGASTPMTTPKPASTPIPTSTFLPTRTPTGTLLPYAIQDPAFQDYQQDCNTDVNITSVDGGSLGLTVNTTMTMLDRGWAVFCWGAKHTWIGTLTYKGFTFASDENDPLQFMVDRTRGYVYLRGKGVVTLPNGTRVTLPAGEVSSGGETLFSVDFNDAAFDGAFDSSLWTFQSGSSDVFSKQSNGAMALTKSSTSGMNWGNLTTSQTWALGEYNYFEARIKLDSDHTGDMGNVVFSLGDVGCAVQIEGINTTPYIWCAQWHTDNDQQWVADYMSGSFLVDYDRWYTTRIEFDSETNEFICSIDGEFFYSWHPANIQDMFGKRNAINLGIWADDGTRIIGYFDDIRVVE